MCLGYISLTLALEVLETLTQDCPQMQNSGTYTAGGVGGGG